MKTLFSPLQEFLKKGDMLLLSLCLLASGFGVALIFSATRYNDNNKEVAVQIVAILLGILVYILCTYVDFESFVEKNWKWLLGFSIIFLLLLLTPFGVTRGGNRNWLQFPGFPILIQPNEVVKIPYILLLAMQIHKLQERGHDIGSVFSVAQIGAHAAFMLALIAGICGDMGMCVVYTMIFAIMSWSAGVKLRWFVLVGSAIVIAFVILWFFVLPKTEAWDKLYLIKRFRVLFDHSYDPQGVGFQQTRSILAIGSGQIFGKGYLQGTMTQSAYEHTLPARDTDFIFAVCGEELGMVGAILIMIVFAALILRGYQIALRAPDRFGSLLVAGITTQIAIQTIFNMGVVTGLLPVTGAALPFFSYGGTSLMMLLAEVGVILSVSRRIPAPEQG